MRVRFLQCGIMLWVMCFSMSVHARLVIEITKGVAAAIPIAVVPFSEGIYPGGEDLAQIVQDDLKMSGYFNPLSRRSLPTGVTYQSIPVDTWQSVGV